MLLMGPNNGPLNVMHGGVVQTGQNNSRGKPRRGMMRRAVFSDAQRKGLERRFQLQKYISKPDRKRLADKLSLKDSQVTGVVLGITVMECVAWSCPLVGAIRKFVRRFVSMSFSRTYGKQISPEIRPVLFWSFVTGGRRRNVEKLRQTTGIWCRRPIVGFKITKRPVDFG